eukprot:7280-Heterococcus_DN1.PRE.1
MADVSAKFDDVVSRIKALTASQTSDEDKLKCRIQTAKHFYHNNAVSHSRNTYAAYSVVTSCSQLRSTTGVQHSSILCATHTAKVLRFCSRNSSSSYTLLIARYHSCCAQSHTHTGVITD